MGTLTRGVATTTSHPHASPGTGQCQWSDLSLSGSHFFWGTLHGKYFALCLPQRLTLNGGTYTGSTGNADITETSPSTRTDRSQTIVLC